MNFNEKVQIMNLINHLNPDLSLIKQNYKIEDPLYYIQEYKIQIKLINYNKILYNVKIPTFITKSDLYSIAKAYQAFYFSNILLVHDNCILNNDESSINNITNGDIIIIVEDRYYPDDTYYNSLIKNKNIKEMINIHFINETLDLCGLRLISLKFPRYITFLEMMKAIYLKFGRDKRDLLLNNYNSFSYDKKKIQDIFGEKMETTIFVYTPGKILGGIFNIYGKEITMKLSKNIIITGTLNSNKKLLEDIEIQLRKKLKKLYIDGREVNIDEEKSLLSLGIKEGSHNCTVKILE